MGLHATVLAARNGNDTRRAFLGTATSFIGALTVGERYPHAPTGKTFRFAKKAEIRFGHAEGFGNALKRNAGLFKAAVNHRGRTGALATGIHRQPQNRARMQFEFRLSLCA